MIVYIGEGYAGELIHTEEKHVHLENFQSRLAEALAECANLAVHIVYANTSNM